MIDVNNLPRAYKEVYEILKYVPKDDYEKIPKNIINKIDKDMDTTYKFEVKNFQNFQEQAMLKETECILAILYRDYWATEEEKKVIMQKEENDRVNKFEIKFNKKSAENNINDSKYKNESLVVREKGFFSRLINYIRSFWKKTNRD